MRIKDIETKQLFEIETKKSHGEELMMCPKCSPTRKKSKEKCFSWNIDKDVGYCSHCNSRFVKYKTFSESVKDYRIPEWKNITSLSDKAVGWFEKRGISQTTLFKMRVYSDKRFMRIKMPNGDVIDKRDAEVIAFPFFMPEEEVPRNIKYRGSNKSFSFESGAELVFYNFVAVRSFKDIIIVEGEIDLLSYVEAGFDNVISVPNGAGAKDMSYLDNYIDEMDSVERFYIAVDFDDAGLKLREELIRRLGSERCLIVTFQGFKDANELLVNNGVHSLRESITNATDIPLQGEVKLESIYDRLQSMYHNGLPTGVKLGFKPIDDLIGWETGRLAIWSGIPSSGKSNLIDFVSLRLNIVNGWKTAYWSPENFPIELHVANLAEKLIGKGFDRDKMNELEFQAAYDYIQDNFFFINCEDNTTPYAILAVAKQLVKRRGIKHLVIDPLNAMTSMGGESDRENENIRETLNKFVTFARKNNILLSLVAHPKKIPSENGRMRVPTMYDISGSHTFYDKADYGLIVYRWFDLKQTQLFVQKVKFRNLGRINETENDGKMMFNPANGRYSEPIFDYRLMDNHNYLKDLSCEDELFDMPLGVEFDDLPE